MGFGLMVGILLEELEEEFARLLRRAGTEQAPQGEDGLRRLGVELEGDEVFLAAGTILALTFAASVGTYVAYTLSSDLTEEEKLDRLEKVMVTTIALASNRADSANTGQIWLMNPDGSGPRQVSEKGWAHAQPAWSADSKSIYAYQ